MEMMHFGKKMFSNRANLAKLEFKMTVILGNKIKRSSTSACLFTQACFLLLKYFQPPPSFRKSLGQERKCMDGDNKLMTSLSLYHYHSRNQHHSELRKNSRIVTMSLT
uniref:(northern house mosquito) hypothetical protein n=1 Tax=Culex pipiens TaxID=7175 RepID=A0A8D8CR02_CULPI